MAHRQKSRLKQQFRDQPELSIVKRAMEGDDAAFTELVLRYSSRIRNRLRQLSGQHSLADDLAQLTFVQAWKNMKRLQSAGAFVGWLHRIALNIWLDEVRRKSLQMAEPEELEKIADGQPDPAKQITGIDLEYALRALNVNERLCVVLSYNDGYTSEEISSLTKMPVGTVKSHIRRGSTKVKQILGAYRHNE